MVLGGCDEHLFFLGGSGGEITERGFRSKPESTIRGSIRLCSEGAARLEDPNVHNSVDSSCSYGAARFEYPDVSNAFFNSVETPFVHDVSLGDELNSGPFRKGKKPLTRRIGPVRHMSAPAIDATAAANSIIS